MADPKAEGAVSIFSAETTRQAESVVSLLASGYCVDFDDGTAVGIIALAIHAAEAAAFARGVEAAAKFAEGCGEKNMAKWIRELAEGK